MAQMSFAEFQASIARDPAAPAELEPALQALWYDARGDWHRAHTLAQEDEGRAGAWVHAYLHRKEGDLGNAGYWYRRAARTTPPAGRALAEEWAEIATQLLAVE